MLQHCGKVFFRVVLIDRKSLTPTIFLDILERKSGKTIGQIRFNHDSSYASAYDAIRMSFDVLDQELLDPLKSTLVEDIVVGGVIWALMDNHRTYPFHPTIYMAVHEYEPDTDIMKSINKKTIEVLKKLGCREKPNSIYLFDLKNPIDLMYVNSIINRM